jgi:hypothetical protein
MEKHRQKPARGHHCMKNQSQWRMRMAINMVNLKLFVGKFVGGLITAVRSCSVVTGEKLGLYQALAEGHPELSRARASGVDVARCIGTRSDTKFPGSCATSRQKRRRRFELRQRVIAAAALACALFAPSPSYSVTASKFDDPVLLELSALGKPGDTIARAREQVLEILLQGNACTAWFQGADPDPAEVVRSLHFVLELRGPSYIYGSRDSHGWQVFKHPWGAKSMENGGRDSTILLNVNGPFFNRTSVVMQLDPRGMLPRTDGNRLLRISSYEGNTPEAQITILLHELGHIIGRLPQDSDSLDGRSSRNTSEVLRHCKTETRAAAHDSQRHLLGTIATFNPPTQPVKRTITAKEAEAIASCSAQKFKKFNLKGEQQWH